MLCAVLSCSGVSSSLGPHGLQPARLSPWGFSRQEYWSGLPSSRLSSQPRDQSQVFRIAGEFFTNKPPRKPQNNHYPLLLWSAVSFISLFSFLSSFPIRQPSSGFPISILRNYALFCGHGIKLNGMIFVSFSFSKFPLNLGIKGPAPSNCEHLYLTSPFSQAASSSWPHHEECPTQPLGHDRISYSQEQSHQVLFFSHKVTPNSVTLGSTVHGISQARMLEWVVISFSKGSNLHLLD